jgi:hypothetical protein
MNSRFVLWFVYFLPLQRFKKENARAGVVALRLKAKAIGNHQRCAMGTTYQYRAERVFQRVVDRQTLEFGGLVSPEVEVNLTSGPQYSRVEVPVGEWLFVSNQPVHSNDSQTPPA